MRIQFFKVIFTCVFLLTWPEHLITSAQDDVSDEVKNAATEIEDPLPPLSIDEFAVNLYKELPTKGNTFFSPLSIAVAVATLYAGAKEQTAREMEKVLGVEDGSPQEVHWRMRSVLDTLFRDQGINVFKAYSTAFVQNGQNVSNEYRDIIRRYYDAYVQEVDFLEQAEAVRQQVNKFVAFRTQDRIKDFLSDPPDPVTKMILINAVYFKGTWQEKFNPDFTSNGEFTNEDGSTSEVPMMFIDTKLPFYHFSDLNMNAIEVPYHGNNLTFLVLMHATENSVEPINQALTPDLIRNVLNKVEEDDIQLYLPRFQLEHSYNLQESLSMLGMPSVFSPSDADLRGISERGDLYAKDIRHKSFVEVNEEGTVAAGATETSIGSRIKAGTFYVNHPFLFCIVDKRTNAILFLGRVSQL